MTVLPMPTSTYQLLRDAAHAWPDAIAARVAQIANALTGLGVRRADAVTLCGVNTSMLYAATLAAQAVGIAAPVNPILSAEHLTQLIRRTVDDLAAAQPADAQPPAPQDLAAFVHTGGTTGAPKIAAQTHEMSGVATVYATLARVPIDADISSLQLPIGKQYKPALSAEAAERAVTDALAEAGRTGAKGPAMYPNVIVVGAGPVGCTAALLLADRGIPVILIERHPDPHPLPRAVHLDDEVARTLHRIGVGDAFLAGSRPGRGLRLLDAHHRVMAEFGRDIEATDNGFPGANMFHQPDLEALLLDRVDRHPLIDLHRGVEVSAIDGVDGSLTAPPVRVHARRVTDEAAETFTGSLVLGCDGASSTVRRLLDVCMRDLHFTERWLVVDLRTETPLDTWDGVEQVCDPARAATFMHVTGDRYRWEFQLGDGEDETDLIPALGALLQPWTGRPDLTGMEVVRSAVYTFRARLATRFQVGRCFLLGDAAHLTPPFIGQGLAAGIRDADNLAWKIAYVLSGRAAPDLLATYQSERRPHAQALIRKAKQIGWAMTGGQDAAAAVRRVLLAAAVRSDRIRDRLASTETPPLRTGALHRTGRLSRLPRPLRVGALIPNPVLCLANGMQVRLDDVLDGAPAMVTARRPEPGLLALCREHGITPVRITTEPDTSADTAWVDARLIPGRTTRLRALADEPSLTVLVRPDRVIAAVANRCRPPRLPWTVS